MSKVCTKCGKTGVFKKNAESRGGYHSICKDCHTKRRKEYFDEKPEARENASSRSRKWKEKNREKYDFQVRSSWLKRNYGITVEEYDNILKSQNGVCLICGTEPTKQRLHVDHVHATGKIRGLLCQSCNTTIGKMKESPFLLRKLADYVERES